MLNILRQSSIEFIIKEEDMHIKTISILLFFTFLFLGCEKKEEKKVKSVNKIEKPKKISSVQEKKDKFLKLLVPVVQKVYTKLNKRYKEVNVLIQKNPEDTKIEELKLKFKVSSKEELLAYLKPHPISITLAQAAMESSWATSRFFKKANNVFGVWSFNKNEPRIAAKQKREEKVIWLKKYKSIENAVLDYYLTIAKSSAFKEFRELKLTSNNPFELVKKLDKYSEKGHLYGEELSSIIRFNKFERFDK